MFIYKNSIKTVVSIRSQITENPNPHFFETPCIYTVNRFIGQTRIQIYKLIRLIPYQPMSGFMYSRYCFIRYVQSLPWPQSASSRPNVGAIYV